MGDRSTTWTREQVEQHLDGVKPWGDRCAIEDHHFLMSAAVSLKRIADALQPADAPANILLSMIEQISENRP